MVSFYESFARRAEASHVPFNPWPSQDVIYVAGGSTANMGSPPGYAADNNAALHFEGAEMREAISLQEGARAYGVGRGSETPLEARRYP